MGSKDHKWSLLLTNESSFGSVSFDIENLSHPSFEGFTPKADGVDIRSKARIKC